MPSNHPNNPALPAGERIAKTIARAGLCSRREAEALIGAGRVAVNGAIVASPAFTVTAQDRIDVDGKPLPQRERTRLFLYYKPIGLVTTTADPEGRPTIFAALPYTLPRLISVGRLDINTEGLLLLTNDGGLARVLELPATGWLRRYRVRAHGHVDQAALDRVRDGITVGGVRYGPVEATLDREQGANVWLTMAIREGKNREIRNVVDALGLQANRLIRVSFGPFQLGEMREGDVVEVKTRVLREQLGERVAAEAGCDFSAPIIQREADERSATTPRIEALKSRGRAEREPPRSRAERTGEKRFRFRDEQKRPHLRGERKRSDAEIPPKPPGRPRRGHAWRAEDAPLSRHYRGAGSKAHQPAADGDGPKRAGLIADRKGRRVLVERFGEKKGNLHEEGSSAPTPSRAARRLTSPPPERGRSASQGSPGGGRRSAATPPRTADRDPTLPFQGRVKSGLKSQGGREQTRGNPPRDDGGKSPRKFGGEPFRKSGDRPLKFGKPRRGRPEPRDRPRGAGPRPSRPRPR